MHHSTTTLLILTCPILLKLRFLGVDGYLINKILIVCSININPKHYFIHWTELLHYSIIFPGKTFMALIKNILFSRYILKT